MQCTGVRVNSLAGLQEILVCDAGLPKTSGQNGGINGVLCRRAFGKFVQEASRVSLSTMVEQYLDPRIRYVGYRGSRPDVSKSDEDGLRRLRIVPLGVKPNHLRASTAEVGFAFQAS